MQRNGGSSRVDMEIFSPPSADGGRYFGKTMSYISNLMDIAIDSAALDALPWDMARENSVLPVAIGAQGLHIVIPADPDYDVETLLKKLRFVLDMDVTADRGGATAIEFAINFYYGRKDAVVHNCPVEFQFLCPKHWRDLAPSSDVNIRYCSTCKQNVFLCSDENEMKLRAATCQCVALAEAFQEPEFMGLIVNNDDFD